MVSIGGMLCFAVSLVISILNSSFRLILVLQCFHKLIFDMDGALGTFFTILTNMGPR